MSEKPGGARIEILMRNRYDENSVVSWEIIIGPIEK